MPVSRKGSDEFYSENETKVRRLERFRNNKCGGRSRRERSDPPGTWTGPPGRRWVHIPDYVCRYLGFLTNAGLSWFACT
jgi:hypothetical protein